MFYRGYDAALGRMFEVDPFASDFVSLSPYHYVGNNPALLTDPSGGSTPELRELTAMINTPGFFDVWIPGNGVFGHVGPGSGNHWSDQYRIMEGNFALMSRNTFQNYYGVNLNSTEGRWAMAQALSVAPTENEFQQIAGAMGLSVAGMSNGTAWLNVVYEPALYAGGLEAENQIAMGTYGIIEVALGGRNGYDVIQAGMGTDVSLYLLSVASYAGGVYEDVRAGQIAKQTKSMLDEYQSIRNFNKGYKTGRQATLASNIIKNVNTLDAMKLASKRMIGVGTVIGLLDVANSRPEERMGKLGWVAADAVMAGIGLTGWGAPIAGVYFLGRFAYGIYEMTSE
ncbi:MAG: hypothetical protein KF845_10450 [Cyclobacteriaceae bacterium]|nr:hypothetical protein [Cyclobacteriaceae bacterium]